MEILRNLVQIGEVDACTRHPLLAPLEEALGRHRKGLEIMLRYNRSLLRSSPQSPLLKFVAIEDSGRTAEEFLQPGRHQIVLALFTPSLGHHTVYHALDKQRRRPFVSGNVEKTFSEDTLEQEGMEARFHSATGWYPSMTDTATFSRLCDDPLLPELERLVLENAEAILKVMRELEP